MPITPISSGQNASRAAIVSNMLNRGGRSLSQLLGSAIQVGRNTSDNQFRQEQSFLTEQRREINLSQRRAEGAQQDLEDTRKFDEEKRRFDVKFGQTEQQFAANIDQQNLDRGVHQQQVVGNLELGAKSNEISAQNSATSVFAAKANDANAKARLGQNQQEIDLRKEGVAAARLDKQTANASALQTQENIQNFGAITDPAERKQAALGIASQSGLDASTRNRFLSEAGIGVSSKQLSALDALEASDPAAHAKAEGAIDGLTKLEVERDAELGKLTRNENEEPHLFEERKAKASARFDKRRQELERRLNLQLGGSSESTADGIFNSIGKKLGQ